MTRPPGSLLVVADSLDGGIGAAVLSHCLAFSGSGWSVTLAAPEARLRAAGRFAAVDVAVPDGAREAARMLAAARHVVRIRRGLRPDVVHAHGLRSLAVVLLGGHRPFVTLHSSDRAGGPTTLGMWLRERFRDTMPALLPGAFSVVPLDRGRWTPLVMASPRLPELDAVAAQPAAEEPLFVHVSRLSPPKRPDVFVDAMAELSRRVPGARGVVLGEGPGRPDLQARVTATGAPVTLVGEVTDMTPWYRQAWGVCLFSESEGLPFVAQEAMWAGRPLVTSPLRGISWFAGDAVRYAADPAGAADRLHELCDPAARAAAGAAGRERAAVMLGDDRFYRTVAGAYAAVCGGPPTEVDSSGASGS